MVAGKPPAEVEVTTSLVEAILRAQRPDLAGLGVSALGSGWDNTLFRIGDRLVARFPRRSMSAELIVNEARWLPQLARELPLPIPAPVFVGAPGQGYPWKWSIVPWLDGHPAVSAWLDLDRCALDMGLFLKELHRPAPPEAPSNPYRGTPLVARHVATIERVEVLGDEVDGSAIRRRWEAACSAPVFSGAPSWIHGDLHPSNILVVDGRVSGVLDFGDLTSGDPATDLALAWMMFPPGPRSRFVEIYGRADEDTWERAAGWALSLAIAHLAHSADDPVMRAVALVTLNRVLEEGA